MTDLDDLIARLKAPTGINAFTQEPVCDRLRAEAAAALETRRDAMSEARSQAIREFCDKAGIKPSVEVSGLPDDVKRWRMEMAIATRRAASPLALPRGGGK